jgi:DNA-binding NtrC family response regulator
MAAAMSGEGRPVARPITLLIVDDEVTILKALQRVVRDDGYRVLTAQNGEEALRLVASEDVDIVLSDIDMPAGMDGLELMVRLRRNYPAVVRLLLTGRATLAMAVGAINDGEVYRFMTKPWDLDELREVLRQAAARAMANRAQQMESGEGDRTARLAALEEAHPGISAVSLSRGVYRIDPNRLEATLEKLNSAVLSACWPPPHTIGN